MKKFLIAFLLITNISFSQDESTAFTSNDNESDKMGEKVRLYDIEIDGLTIPLEISYNHRGFQINEAPGVVGLGWKFHDIGKITRKVNHLPDDYQVSVNPSPDKGGWFFNDNTYINETGRNTPNSPLIKGISDVSPDFYNFNSSFGKSALFTFDKNVISGTVGLTPLFLDANDNFTLDFNLNNLHYGVNNYQDVVFDLHEENGFTYSFIGGPSNNNIYRSGTSQNMNLKNYYISIIKSNHSNEEVTVSYLEKTFENRILYETGYKTATSIRPIGTYRDYFFRGENKLVINEIVTPKEKISFEYRDYMFYDNPSGPNEYLPLLDAVYIKNLNDEIITSFHFVYEVWLGNNRPLLTKIYKGEKGVYYSQGLSLMNVIKIKEFDYYQYSQLDIDLQYSFPNYNFNNIDLLGYYNLSNNARLIHGESGICRSSSLYNVDRTPNLNAIKMGVLKKSINNLGGTVEYDYILNAEVSSSNNVWYGGGLKISSITEKPDVNTTYTTTYEYSGYSGFYIDSDNPLNSQMSGGTIKSVNSYVNEELWDRCQECDFVNHYQTSGNIFTTVISKKFIQIDSLDIMEQGVFEQADLYLKTKTTYRPNYKTLVRTPLVEKIETFKEYVFNPSSSFSLLISKKEFIYDFELNNVNYSASVNANRVYSGGVTDCQGDYFYSAPNTITISNRPINRIEMPLKSIITEDYSTGEVNGRTVYQINKLKEEVTYFGENNPNYQLNVLRPKEITVYKNEFLISKKKYKYLIEEFIPNAGLQDLDVFNNESKTLLSNESDWTFDGSQWLLAKAELYQYYNDGKIKSISSTGKSANNTFFNESNFNPYYLNGELTGVPTVNKIEYEYDSNGKINFIKNDETKKFKTFYRENDLSENSINSVLEGNTFSNEFEMYRTSFENLTGPDYLETSNAYTGNKVFVGEIFDTGKEFPQGYIVSFWSYHENNWIFNEYIHNGGIVKVILPTLSDSLDELWVRPANTLLTAKTNNKYFETSHIINDKGFIIKNIYDGFGRLIKQVDQDGNINNERIYNFTQE